MATSHSRHAGRRLAAAAAFVWLAGIAAQALADYALIEHDGLNVRAAVNGAATLITDSEICFGVPSGQGWCNYTGPDADSDDPDITRFDAFVQARLAGDYALGAAGRLFGEVSYAAAMSAGAGDMYGLNADNPKKVYLELANLGWASGDPLFGLGDLQITVGKQRFGIGDGFLIYDGLSDLYHVAYYSAPGKAFDDETVVVQFDADPVRAKAFVVRTPGNHHVDDGWSKKGSDYAGFDVEFAFEGRGVIGLTRFDIRKAPRQRAYEDASVTSLRGQGNPFTVAGMSPLFLASEVAFQRGGGGNVDANAWYLETGYKFEDAPWAPYLGYRYSLFSGDDPNTPGKNETWSSLVPGFTRAWGTWFQGEIISNYLWHSNLRVHMLRATAAPADSLSANLLLYDFDYDQPPGGVTARDVAHELNLIVDWTVSSNAGFSFISGIAWPDDGLAQRTGFGDETSTILGIYGWVSY